MKRDGGRTWRELEGLLVGWSNLHTPGRVVVIGLDDVIRRILASAVEDWCGLYEVIWELNGAYPGDALGEKYRQAENGVRELLKKDWVELVRWECGSDPERRSSVGRDELEAVLMNPVSWYPEYAGVQLQIGATEEGERAYAVAGQGRPA